jgi:hypothetical protein
MCSAVHTTVLSADTLSSCSYVCRYVYVHVYVHGCACACTCTCYVLRVRVRVSSCACAPRVCSTGSKLSRCVNVSRILRSVIQPERVRRLRGGLNGWKQAQLPVDGDARMMFAGRTMDNLMIS